MQGQPVWVPETVHTVRDLLVHLRHTGRHDPLVALRLIYQMFAKLLDWIVLRTRSDTTTTRAMTRAMTRG